MTQEMLLFLLTKPATRLTGARCQSPHPVVVGRQMGGAYSHLRHEGLKGASACTRPVWGDGTVDGIRYDLCSICWHNWCSRKGAYRLLQANPAGAAVTASALERLFVTRSWDRSGPSLPEIGSALPDTLPEGWS